jgi:hypothetical protein
VLLAYPLFTIPGKLIGMRFRDVVDVLSGVFYCSVCMAVSIMLIGWVLPISWPDWLLLLIQILAGIILYLALINSFRIKAYIELLELIKEQWVSNTAEKQHLSVLKK